MSSDLSYRDRATFTRMSTGKSDREIAEDFGISSFTVRYWRDRHGLPRSQAKGANVKYATNRDFFARIDTPEKAYVLGFVIADGSVHKNGKVIDIALKQSDAELLVAIGALLNCAAPVRPKVATGFRRDKPTARLNLCGKKLVSDLNALGVYHNKTVTATYPVVAAHLESHVIRGLWDGDGYIGKRQFALCGTDRVIEGVTAAVERHTGHRLTPSRKAALLYCVGSRRDRDVLAWMYAGATISLNRKAEAFRLYWS